MHGLQCDSGSKPSPGPVVTRPELEAQEAPWTPKQEVSWMQRRRKFISDRLQEDRVVCYAHSPDTVVLFRGPKCPLCEFKRRTQ